MASEVFKQVYVDMFRSAGCDKEIRLVDIGSKDGVIASQLEEEVGFDSISIDIGFDIDDMGALSTEFVQSDGTRMPLQDNTIDVVISNMVFEHIQDVEGLIQESARVLKPNGTFVTIFPNRFWPIDDHGFPFGTTLLPRHIGKRVFRLTDYQSEYYNRFMHPSSSVGVRRKLDRHFDDVSFESSRLFDVEYESSRRGDLLNKAKKPVSTSFNTPGLRFLSEMFFPIPIYHASSPITHS